MNSNQEYIPGQPETAITDAGPPTPLLESGQPSKPPSVAIRGQEQPPMTASESMTLSVHGTLAAAFAKASTLQLTKEEIAILTTPFSDNEVEIRPNDGLIYIPHITVSNRLMRVFGPGQWCMIRHREWVEDRKVNAEWIMLVRGCFIGASVGAMNYDPTNPRMKMNYADALEGTRGEALRRIAGKDLACGDIVWNPAYARDWVAKNAESYPERDYSGKTVTKWRKKVTSEQAPPALTFYRDSLVALATQAGVIDWVEPWLHQGWTKDGKEVHWLSPNETVFDLTEKQAGVLVANWSATSDKIRKFMEENKEVTP